VTAKSPFLNADRLALFPDSTRVQNDSLTIAGHDLASLADLYGTPLYIYDRTTLDASVKTYMDALAAYYSASSRITYAGKAFLCTAIAQWTQQHDLIVDCTGVGETAIAVAARVKRENILVHGVNKSMADLKSAIQNAGTIVVDNLTELHNIHVILSEATLAPHAHLPRVQVPGSAGENLPRTMQDSSVATPPQSDIAIWLRLLPGMAVRTHHSHTQTGQHDSKFGMTREEILEAAQFCKKEKLLLKGIHFHQGSNFRDPEPLIPAIDMALDLAKEIGFKDEWHFCPGGGWGMAYHEDELPNPPIESYVRGIGEAVTDGCQQRGLILPHLHLEPGRSLIARAGVTIYHVGATKQRGERTWLLTDGGMADNPRFALYGARYSCLTVAGISREMNARVHIAGPYCESGDVIIEDLLMPDVKEGELIAIPVAGAYHLSMSSKRNRRRYAQAGFGIVIIL
jgi:diaminopimelate decarboxylase